MKMASDPNPKPFDIDILYGLILDRQIHPRDGSYTNFLLHAGTDEIAKKIGEEAIEVILAVKGQGRQRLIEEIADLIYHLLTLMVDQGLSLADIQHELSDRHFRKSDA
jgi:phosphoribosyl-ATP pyrophosphohydrolase